MSDKPKAYPVKIEYDPFADKPLPQTTATDDDLIPTWQFPGTMIIDVLDNRGFRWRYAFRAYPAGIVRSSMTASDQKTFEALEQVFDGGLEG